jgi:hypothetical protein
MHSRLTKLASLFNYKLDPRILIIGFFLFSLLLIGNSVEAHTDGKLQLASEQAGPFNLTVWTAPDPARVGEVHVALAVVLAENAAPVLDADVMVEMAPLQSDGSSFEEPAKTENSDNKFLYEAIFNVAQAGDYLVTMKVDDEAGKSGEAFFELELLPEDSFNWLLLVPVILGLAAISLLLLSRRY